jgi:hypothetical protein
VIYTHVAAALLGAVVTALGAWQVQDWRYNARIAQMQQAHAKSLKATSDAALAQQKDALAKLQELNAVKLKVEQDYALEKRKAAVAARSARAELDGLRQELYALPSPDPSAIVRPPTTTGRADGATTERQLLGECSAALVEVAADADLLAAQLVGLQSYVQNVQKVCTAPTC